MLFKPSRRRSTSMASVYKNVYTPGVGKFTNYEKEVLNYFACLIEEHREHWEKDKDFCRDCEELKKISGALYQLMWGHRRWVMTA